MSPFPLPLLPPLGSQPDPRGGCEEGSVGVGGPGAVVGHLCEVEKRECSFFLPGIAGSGSGSDRSVR